MNIETKKNISAGSFIITAEGWVVFDLKKHGIICTVQDFPIEGKFCSKICNGKVYIPKQIEYQYDLFGSVPIRKLSNNAFVIEKSCRGVMPKFPEFVSYTNVSVDENIKYETTMEMFGYALNINKAGHKLVNLDSVVRVHIGDFNCVEIIPNQTCSGDIGLLKNLYGDQLNRLDASYIEYQNPNKSESQFCVPAFFAKRVGIEKGDDIRVCVLDDGRVLLTPIPKTDDLTGEIILPEQEKSEKATLCEDCSESDDLGALILELKKMQELVKEQHRTNELLRIELESCIEENNSLKTDVNSLKRMVRGLLLDR